MSTPEFSQDELCEDPDCNRPVECFVCASCAAHCVLGDPEACWEAHEAWRLGKPDPAFTKVLTTAATPGKPITLNGLPVPPISSLQWAPARDASRREQLPERRDVGPLFAKI